MSIFSGLFNLGIGTGTAIGGAVVSGPGIAWIGFVGGAITVVGVILAITVLFPAIRRAQARRLATSPHQLRWIVPI